MKFLNPEYNIYKSWIQDKTFQACSSKTDQSPRFISLQATEKTFFQKGKVILISQNGFRKANTLLNIA